MPALRGTVPPLWWLNLASAGKPVDLPLLVLSPLFGDLTVDVWPYHTTPLSAVCVPQWDKIPTLYQQVNRLTQYGNRKEGMFCCFTHEGVCTQIFGVISGITRVSLGLIWLRHARARMGHQVVASPTVRYILRGERNRSVAVNSLSLIEIWETCTLLLKHPPTSRARTPLARRRENEGGRPERLCHPVGGRAAALRVQN